MSSLQTATLVVILAIGVTGLVAAGRAVRIVGRYERGVVFRLGGMRDGTHGPGLILVVPWVDRLVKVDLQITTMSLPAQDGVTRDNVTVRVDAVVYLRVVDPVKALVNVVNYESAVSQVAQTSLRTLIGRTDLDELVSDQDRINTELTAVVGSAAESPWGVKIERVELTDVALPVPVG
jgi:regulator of protease activity HflC (stomatin/prohibitin superfamily)